MPITFNTLLQGHGIDLGDVRLLRHQDQRALPGRDPFSLWRNDPENYITYQSVQEFNNQKRFGDARYWATFVVPPSGETLFAGLFSVTLQGELRAPLMSPTSGKVDLPGTCNKYDLEPVGSLDEYVGRLVIDWGPANRAWIQRADNQDKPVLELRRKFEDPEFPGFEDLQFLLSDLDNLPESWKAVLSNVGGVYLLICPETGGQYVGVAHGAGGFLQRWTEYAQNGHGGNQGLIENPSKNYVVSVLETVSSTSAASKDVTIGSRWKRKLMTREFGLNRN